MPQIQGLPPGAVVRPFGTEPQEQQPRQPTTVTGLPSGAVVRSFVQPEQPQEPTDPNEPFKIREEDKGVLAGLKRTGKNLVELPANLYHAIFDDYRDDEEKIKADATAMSMESIHGVPLPPRIALMLNRLIIDPMIAESEKAETYDKIAQSKKTPADWETEPNRVKRAVKWTFGEFSGNDEANEANHRANMHHIASMVPVLGPIAGDIMEHYVQGDKSGAVSELLANVAGGEILKAAGGKIIRKVAPQVRKIAGHEVPVLASQTGSKAGAAAEGITNVSGKAGETVLKTWTKQWATLPARMRLRLERILSPASTRLLCRQKSSISWQMRRPLLRSPQTSEKRQKT
jgi:hypothetical protein